MISCFLHICRIFFCCEDEENQKDQKERHEFERRSCYGSYQSPPQQRENLLVSGAYTYTPSWKASSPHSSPSAASAPSYLSSSLAASLPKPSSPSLTKTAVSSFVPPSPKKAQPNRAASGGAKASQLSEPSLKASSSSSSSKASSAASLSSYLSSSLAASLSKPSSPSLTKTSFAPPSPAKAQPNHVASAGAKASQLSEPSSRAYSSSSSSLTPPLAASFAPPPSVKAQSPHAASTGPKDSLQWKPVSSKASSASCSFLTPSTASSASPSPAKAQPPHAASAGAKASRLSEPSTPSLVSSQASSSSSSSLTPHSIASFAPPPSVKAQSPHAASTGPKDSLQWIPVSSNASSASCSFLTPSAAPFASPSPVKARSTHALSASGSPAKACPLSEPSSPSSVSSKASSSSSSSSAPFASPQFDQRNKMGQLPRYEIPKKLQEQIRNDVVPKVLRRPLSPSTYADYFAALLYAEDYYCEKWSEFLLRDVTLELRKKEGFKIQNSVGAKKRNNSTAHMDKPFVAFEIDSVPENRPYLLSRDHVLVRPVGKQIEPFQGILLRVEKSKWVLAEFSDDFHKQHSPLKKYDVSFSFNRVCLKRSHHAVSAAMDPFLCNILFPDPPLKAFLGPIRDSDFTQNDRKSDVLTIIRQILRLKSPQPYLLEGPLSQVPGGGGLSDMGKLIQIAIFRLYETCSTNRILVCAPRNLTLDELTKGLLTKGIPESRIFRANAAFRDFGDVPDDIMPTCLFEDECFTCPPLVELKSFRVVTSTFISSYRLYAAGIGADHFTHIFLVDASSSMEPETIVAFANFVGKTTAIVVTGSTWDSPARVRSDIARKIGLKRSLFQRLLEMEPYSLHDPMCIAHI